MTHNLDHSPSKILFNIIRERRTAPLTETPTKDIQNFPGHRIRRSPGIQPVIPVELLSPCPPHRRSREKRASRNNKRRTHRPSGKICTFSNLTNALPNRVNLNNLSRLDLMILTLCCLRISHHPLSFCDCANCSARYSCNFCDFFVR